MRRHLQRQPHTIMPAKKKSTKHSDLELALQTHVTALCISERNTTNCPEGLDRARDYLRGAFEGMGYQTSLQEFPADGMICANVEAVTPGFVGCDKPHFIVGAHYDSAPGTVGADDNASAVAILLELARVFSGKPGAEALRFVGYTNEECPHFYTGTMGSVVHAKACRKQRDKITGMICLESLGVFSNEPGTQELPEEFNCLPEEVKQLVLPAGLDPAVGNFLAVIGNPASAKFMMSFVSHLPDDEALPVLATELLDIRLSDHLAYWDERYPAIMLTDTAPYRNAHYHLASDTPEKLNYPKMALLTERITDAIERLLK
jgi:hypothetical protein